MMTLSMYSPFASMQTLVRLSFVEFRVLRVLGYCCPFVRPWPVFNPCETDLTLHDVVRKILLPRCGTASDM